MAMVMPRSRSSGALSIVSKARYSASPFRLRYLVMAAVSDVLPWSMWPIVPILTCGLVRSNFFLAMLLLVPIPLEVGARQGWSPHWDLNPRPLPYQGSALPAELCGPGRCRKDYLISSPQRRCGAAAARPAGLACR